MIFKKQKKHKTIPQENLLKIWRIHFNDFLIEEKGEQKKI
jgi:hypothetical protein